MKGRKSDTQDTCRYNRDTFGVCTSYKNCPQLHGSVIFPNPLCQPGHICCPNWTQLDQTTKSAATYTATTVSSPPSPKVSTQLPLQNKRPAANPNPAEIEIVTTTTTALPVQENFGYNFNPRGLNILRTQKCGSVYASKNPNGTNVEAEILEFPWMALLQYEEANGKKEFACGGSLITERWVLTAAQCIKPNLVGVRLGEYDIQEGTIKDCTQENGIKMCTTQKDFKIIKAITHPEFDQKSELKDLGLIKLKTRAQRSSNIKPICLPIQTEHFDAPYDEKKLLVAGWNSRREGSSTILKKHTVKQQSFVVCYIAFLVPQTERESKMCLESICCEQHSSTCSGDPGSPVFWLVKSETDFYTQIGIVPFGMDKCGPAQDMPYYAERVANSMDWITDVLGEDK